MIELHVKSTGNVVVLECEGCMTHDTIGKLQKVMYKIIKQGSNTIILSMQKVSLLLSTGIHFFVESHDLAEKSGGKLILANVSKEIDFTIKVARLDKFFTIAKDMDEAFAIANIKKEDLKVGLPEKEQKKEDGPAPEVSLTGKTEILKKAPPDSLEEILSQDIISAEEKRLIDNHRRSTRKIEKRLEKADFSDQELSDEEIRKLIKVYIPERAAIEILDYFVSKGNSFGQAEKIAKVVNLSERKVKKIMKKISQTGIFKSMGGETYNYAPTTELRWKMQEFFKKWHRTDEHSRIFKMMIEAGK